MDTLLWKLFKETGDIKYYLLKQKLEKRSDKDEDSKRGRDLSIRDKLQ